MCVYVCVCGWVGVGVWVCGCCVGVKLTSTAPFITQQNETREAATHEGTLCIGAVLLTIVSHHHTLINVCGNMEHKNTKYCNYC